MKIFYLLICILSIVSCATTKHNSTVVISPNNYLDSQRHADYEKLVKGTSLEDKKPTQTIVNTNDTISYPCYIGTASFHISVYHTASFIYTDFFIDEHQQFVFQDTAGEYYHIRFGDMTGYILKIAVAKKKGYTKEQMAALPFRPETGTYTDEATLYVIRNSAPNTKDYSGSNTGSYSGAKTVHVNGYTRKDGTHVNSYYRSAPRH